MLFWPALLALALWGAKALLVQAQPRWRAAVLAGLAAALAAVIWAKVAQAQGGPALAALAGALVLWFLSLRPRADRDWAPDVARIVTGTVQGNHVTLHDIRAFRWRDRDHAAEHWHSRSFDLDRLTEVDLFTSVWDNPRIAHLLLSFGFTDGARVVFSVEIRRERGEAFSKIGGFFRQFELALIAADEDDIVKLRTNHRREEVRRFALRLTPDQARRLFLGYVALGNDLAARPRWYNTLTANCTTVVWQLARMVHPRLGLHSSLLLSAGVPGWLHGLGLIDGDQPFATVYDAARISARAQALPPEADYSDGIRQMGI